MKKYLPLKPNPMGATHLLVEVTYSYGSINYLAHKAEMRGYYLSVTPVSRDVRDGYATELRLGFAGQKALLLPVHLRSDKQMEAAMELAETYGVNLIKRVVMKSKLKLEESV